MTASHSSIQTHMDLSTAHLRPTTHVWLDEHGRRTAADRKSAVRWVAMTRYGWFVYADEEPTDDDFPADLIACMQFSRKHQCGYILFDADAVAVPELPTYE